MIKKNSIINTFKCALNGILIVLSTQRNFIIHFCIFIIVIISGILLKISYYEFIAILLISTIVFSLEIMNTSIEKTLDYINKEYDDNIKIIKDISAGSVLLSAIFAVIIGLIIFLPKIIKFLNSFINL